MSRVDASLSKILRARFGFVGIDGGVRTDAFLLQFTLRLFVLLFLLGEFFLTLFELIVGFDQGMNLLSCSDT